MAFFDKRKQNSRDNYLCVIITLSPNGKKSKGKQNEKKKKKKKPDQKMEG